MQSPKMEEGEKEEKRRKLPKMKAAQLLEFQMQALVYRYIKAGLRVPQDLVVTIWNSLAHSSSSSSKYHLHHNNHSFSMLSEKGLNQVETETARCRRTDGKKWRCSNTVLPLQKYCERHMHRGRKRSRKLVESSYEVAASSTKHDNTYGLDSTNKTQCVSHETMAVTIAALPSAIPCDGFTYPCLQVVPAQGDKSLPCVQKSFPESAATFSNIRKHGGLVPGIHFSPDTVLQDNEPGRCRRTDGKKWRCGKDALTGQKYCDKHMHRGIKKKDPVDTNSNENAGFTAKTAPRSVSCNGGDGSKLFLALSRVSDEKSISSCSTDTTITDTAIRGEEEDDSKEEMSVCSSGV